MKTNTSAAPSLLDRVKGSTSRVAAIHTSDREARVTTALATLEGADEAEEGAEALWLSVAKLVAADAQARAEVLSRLAGKFKGTDVYTVAGWFKAVVAADAAIHPDAFTLTFGKDNAPKYKYLMGTRKIALADTGRDLLLEGLTALRKLRTEKSSLALFQEAVGDMIEAGMLVDNKHGGLRWKAPRVK